MLLKISVCIVEIESGRAVPRQIFRINNGIKQASAKLCAGQAEFFYSMVCRYGQIFSFCTDPGNFCPCRSLICLTAKCCYEEIFIVGYSWKHFCLKMTDLAQKMCSIIILPQLWNHYNPYKDYGYGVLLNNETRQCRTAC